MKMAKSSFLLVFVVNMVASHLLYGPISATFAYLVITNTKGDKHIDI